MATIITIFPSFKHSILMLHVCWLLYKNSSLDVPAEIWQYMFDRYCANFSYSQGPYSINYRENADFRCLSCSVVPLIWYNIYLFTYVFVTIKLVKQLIILTYMYNTIDKNRFCYRESIKKAKLLLVTLFPPSICFS